LKSLTLDNLLKAARAGRVAHSGFLDANETAELNHKLKNLASTNVWGGFAAAKRRVLTVFPDNIPNATTKLAAVYCSAEVEADEFRMALQKYLADYEIGDIVKHKDGLSAIILDSKLKQLPKQINLYGSEYELEEIGLEYLQSSKSGSRQIVVPSMRVDVIGAKALNVSRSYFAKGIKAGNVAINGQKASKSSSAEVGDEIYAQGLGRILISEILGKTRRGNLKIKIDMEKS